MNVTIIIGGQFGGEGKGKITAHLCRTYRKAKRCQANNTLLKFLERQTLKVEPYL